MVQILVIREPNPVLQPVMDFRSGKPPLASHFAGRQCAPLGHFLRLGRRNGQVAGKTRDVEIVAGHKTRPLRMELSALLAARGDRVQSERAPMPSAGAARRKMLKITSTRGRASRRRKETIRK